MPEGAQLREHIKQNLAVEVLRKTGQVQLAAFGYSMLPSLWPGDHLTIEARAFERISVGDVVLFVRSDRLFIHRVVRVEKEQIVTRGDAVPSQDTPVSPGELLGVVASVRRTDGQSVPVAPRSRLRRLVGLSLAYSVRLRSLALRWHAYHHGHTEVPAVPEHGTPY